MRRLLASLLSGLLLLSTATAALGYHTLGGRWTTVTNLPYWNYTSYSADATAYASAISEWNATSTPIWLIGAGHIDYEKVGMFDTTNSSVGWDGITYLFPSNSANPYTYAQIDLNYYYTNGYSAAERLSVSAHEYGHVFGLAHTNGAVLMNPYTCGSASRWCTYSKNAPTTDEVGGINAIY